MTLGGLALAVGILVDEATVAIENIHTHLARGRSRSPEGCWTRAAEVVVPRLLAMLSVVAVFVPSFFMTGVSRSLFVPLSLAVGFSMIASFFLSSSLVPVLSVWLLGKAGRRGTPTQTPTTGSTGCGTAWGGSCSAWLRRAGSSWRRMRRSPSRSSSSRRPDARARDLSGRRRQPVPAAVPRACGHEVRVDRTAGDRRARRDQAGRRSEQRGDHARLRRRPALVVSDQHDLPVDRRLARRRAAGGAQAGGGHSAHGLRGRRCAGGSANDFRPRSSRSSRATSSIGS